MPIKKKPLPFHDRLIKKLGDDISYAKGSKFSFFRDALSAIDGTLLPLVLPKAD
jgi:hypothetical protein